MSDERGVLTGGCLCGAVRYEVTGEPLFSGLCYCADCRKASGAGAVPFMGVAAASFRLTGETRQARTRLQRGGEAVRNFCPACGSLLFGGDYGVSREHTVYAGTLDDPSAFHPTAAIMLADRAPWAPLLEGLVLHEGMPG